MSLNPEQSVVAAHTYGPALVVARAGTGKTHTIIERIKNLVQSGVDPSRVLAVTFSRKAADEMNDRLNRILPDSGARVGTFHALALQIIKAERPDLARWTIDDSNRFKFCLKDACGFKELNWKEADITFLESFVSRCKSSLARPHDHRVKEIARDVSEENPRVSPRAKNVNLMIAAYERAEELRADRQLLTFDDMLMDAVEMLQTDAAMRHRWQTKWDFVIQDEAQDQNLAQLTMGEVLAAEHRNYMLVGDPAQSIYGWRGADRETFLSFADRWNATVYTMGRNYRCGSTIIDCANASLAAMPKDFDAQLVAERRGRDGSVVAGNIVAATYEDMDDEATDIATTIATMAADGTKYSNFLVLYRTNAQSRAIEEAMLSNRIPYVVVGGTTFYERKEIRDLLAYLRLAEGRGDVDDMKRCINAPFRFLGKAFIDRCASELSSVRKGSDRSIAQLVVDAVRSACRSGGVQGRQRDSANEWCDLIDEMHERVVATQALERQAGTNLPLFAATPVSAEGDAGRPATVLEQIVLRTQYSEWITRDEGQESTENNRLTNVRELVRAAARFRTASDFLDYIDDTIKRAKAAKKGDQVDRVTMMSVHRSKGLEWPHVFVIGANEGIFPHSCADAEEERRLFYVAITRAKDTCQVSSVRVISTSRGVRFMPPSPFIGEAGIPSSEPVVDANAPAA